MRHGPQPESPGPGTTCATAAAVLGVPRCPGHRPRGGRVPGRRRARPPRRVRADAPFAGVWRRRLALKAAAASTRIARRGEDEAKLRDAFFLRQNGADPGPAGRMLLAWRGLDRSAPLKPALAKAGDEAVLHAAGLFGLKVDDALQGGNALLTGMPHVRTVLCPYGVRTCQMRG
jgi:hypothetical protein